MSCLLPVTVPILSQISKRNHASKAWPVMGSYAVVIFGCPKLFLVACGALWQRTPFALRSCSNLSMAQCLQATRPQVRALRGSSCPDGDCRSTGWAVPQLKPKLPKAQTSNRRRVAAHESASKRSIRSGCTTLRLVMVFL